MTTNSQLKAHFFGINCRVKRSGPVECEQGPTPIGNLDLHKRSCFWKVFRVTVRRLPPTRGSTVLRQSFVVGASITVTMLKLPIVMKKFS